MSQKEAQRLVVIEQVLQGKRDQAQAAVSLGLSVRQIKRLCRRVREQGPAGLISQRRGVPSNRRIDSAVREHFMDIVRERYADFGPQLAHEYLTREHGLTHSVETLRGWMQASGLWQARRRRAVVVHSPRARRACVGELVQIDGSHHDWLEGRGPRCCLIAFIDDATSRVQAAHFCQAETTQDYLSVLRHYVQARGVPAALYSDRHSIFTKHDPEDATPTQFERALLQLEIEPICAHSPQAKGRVERLFQTLQNRMVKAMRLAGIGSMEQANAWLAGYLGEHNERFAVAPALVHDAHRPWGGSPAQLARICALHHQRHLSSQLSCQFEGQIVQLDPNQPHTPRGRARVDIAQHADGLLEVMYHGHVLRHRRFTVHEHLKGSSRVDGKQLNDHVDRAIKRQRVNLARLQAQIVHQDSQRAAGIYVADTPASAVPRTPPGRYGLRPSQPGGVPNSP
ncbi:MAG: ISNCY family transposase [Burkholderiaceae bacterium]|nr:ISNCY family transposase [Burkholderiaceae bacterium]